MATPKVTRTLFDNNLDRTTPQGPQNRSVVILGTGTDGPMYEAVKVTSAADASDVFGALGDGTLVRGIKECFDAQVGSQAAPNVWGMRIGGNKSGRSSMSLSDASSNVVLNVEALYDGATYNGVFLKKALDTQSNAQMIFLWNPKTQLFSKFSPDLNVNDLAAAINSDPNASSVVYATPTDFEDDFEVAIDTGTSEGSHSGNDIRIQLANHSQEIAGNGIESIDSIYSISDSAEVTLAGGQQTYTPGTFVSGTANNNWSGIVSNQVVAAVTETLTNGAITNLQSGDADFAISVTLDANENDLIEDDASKSVTLTFTKDDNAEVPYTVDVAISGNSVTGSITAADLIAGGLAAGDNTTSAKIEWDETVTVAPNAAPGSVVQFKVNEAQTAIEFGATQPYQLTFKYHVKKYYELGSNVTVNDSVSGDFSIVDTTMTATNAEGSGGAEVIYFGLDYQNIGDDPNWGTTEAPFHLGGGANGAVLTNSDLVGTLNEAYENFVSDFFDIMCVVDLTMDAKLASGAYAGFGQQMSTFLDGFNGEMMGVIGFEPLVGTGVGGRVLRENVKDRVTWLTSPNSSPSPGNIASILSDFHQPFMYAVDIEGIFSANGVRYTAISTAAVAGLMAAMPTEEAIFRFTVPGVSGMRYRYTEIDQTTGSRQIDLLSDSRIATGMIDGGVKITESRTLAKPGSDFENLMTVLILQEVLQICRTVAKDFIGKVSSEPLIQAFQSTLDKQLGDAMVPRVLRGFKAPITMTPGERVLGQITIPLTLSPQFEIRDVHYNVQLTAEDITAA